MFSQRTSGLVTEMYTSMSHAHRQHPPPLPPNTLLILNSSFSKAASTLDAALTDFYDKTITQKRRRSYGGHIEW